MEKPIEKECDRESFLKDNCDKVEEKGYTKAYKWKNYLGRENNASMCDIPLFIYFFTKQLTIIIIAHICIKP